MPSSKCKVYINVKATIMMHVNTALTASLIPAGILRDAQVFILVFATAFLAAAWLLHRLRHTGRRKLPPGPWHIPYIGSPQLLTSSSHLAVTRLGKVYGKVFTLFIGSDPLIVLNSYDVIKEALVEHADIFSDRFTFKPMERTINLKGSLIFENGPAWKARRRVTMTALYNPCSRRNLEVSINEEACWLCQEFGQQDGRPFDPCDSVSAAVSNIICSVSYGRRFSHSDPVFRHVLSNLNSVLHCSFVGSVLMTLPVISHIPGLNSIRRALAEVFDFNRRMVKEHMTTFDPNNIRDVIDSMLKEGQRELERDADSNDLVFTDELIARSVYDLFAAGTDTSANTLLWALLLMTQFPNVQAKVQREIDDVIGSRKPLVSDSTSMPYTTATLLEVQRFRVPAPFVPPRCTKHDVDILGFWIPKGTQIWVNLWAVLHDPSLWSNPESFDPTRFLSGDGQEVIVPETFIPFGAGRRTCVGKQLSHVTSFILFATIMQRLTVSWPPEGAEKVDLQGHNGLTLAPNRYKICAIERRGDV